MLLANSARRIAGHAGLVGAALLLAGCAGLSPAPQATPPAPEAATVSAPAAAPVTVATPAPPTAPPTETSSTAPAPRGTPSAGAVAPAGAASAAPQAAAPVYRDLWERVRAGFAMPDLDTPLVQEKERFYRSNPEALNRMFVRGSRYLHYIVEEVEKRGMPTELALLPFVESAMNPVALSSAKAAGLWQFIPSTGRQYELSQNWWVDNRRDVEQSTRAALDYLQKIYEMHDRDWFLALASYNWGENAVARAVKNNRARGKPTDYLSLSMPAETRHYVPKLIALKHIVLRPDAYGVALPALPDRPYFATIEKTRPIDLTLAAQFAGMSVDEFVALNPAHNRPVITASRNNRIKLPADRVDDFQAAMDRHTRSNKPLASWQPYTLKPGESVDDVARRGNVATGELLRANGLPPGARILAGTQLLAPQPGVKDELQVESFAGARVYQQVTVPAVYHVVRKRDSLAAIATSYGTSVTQLRAWNGGVKSPTPGSSLMVRASTTQTVLTTADGDRQVVARAAAPQPPASRAEPALVQADPPRAKPAAAPAGAKSPPPKPVKAAAPGKRDPASAKSGATRKPTVAAPAAPAPRPVVRTALPDPAPARPAATTPKPRQPRT